MPSCCGCRAARGLLSVLRDERAVRVVYFLVVTGGPRSLRRIALATGMGYRSAGAVLESLMRVGLVVKVYSSENLGLYEVPGDVREELRCLLSAASGSEEAGD